jgi:hypothetical protein
MMSTKLNNPISRTRPYGFGSIGTEADVEDHHALDGSNTSLVSSRTNAQPEEEDPMDEGAENEGRSG